MNLWELGILLAFAAFSEVKTEEEDTARTCIDKETGVCELDGLFSFCYINTKTGDYSCDKDKKCAAKSDTLRGKTEKGGCFGDGTCCCKSQEPLCNYMFLKAAKENITDTQKCNRQLVTETQSTVPKECKDAYCYTIRFSLAGLTGGYMSGCHSLLRFFLRNPTTKDHQYIEAMSQKTCAQVFQEEADKLGVDVTQIDQACAEVDSVDSENNPINGKFCCCKGELCNEILWPVSQDLGDFIPGMGGGMARSAIVNMAIFALGLAAAVVLFFRD